MSDIIQLLPDHIANQIAAGEVVQRPASVVKELLENAIDAGGNEIILVIKESGKTLINVVDNGIGMSTTDARMCFERHATSKIKKADDLYNLHTKGFRGEALASIAAVAQVQLKTKQDHQDLGEYIEIESNKILKQESISCATGTSISVKNLFYNIPARRNFLKSDNVEYKHITEEFTRISLTHPEVSFKYYSDDVLLFHLPIQNFKQRICALFGTNYDERLVPIEEETTVVKLTGFIGKPDFARKTRGEQYFFVNNRFIKSPYFNHAIQEAYQQLINKDMHVSYFIHLHVDPARLDVNIHPTKTEVKFEDDKIIYTYIKSAARRSVGQYNIAPSLDFEVENNFAIDFTPSKHPVTQPQIKVNPNYNPFDPQPKTLASSNYNKQNWERAYDIVKKDISNKIEIANHEQATLLPQQLQIEQAYQIFNSYILIPHLDKVIIIDQHLAHERVLFDQLIQSVNANQIGIQQCMFPQHIQLSPSNYNMVLTLLNDFKKIGFDISNLGNNSVAINGIPVFTNENTAVQTIEIIIEKINHKGSMQTDDTFTILAKATAQLLAIKPKRTLNKLEIETLINNWINCENKLYAPNGKKITAEIFATDIEQKLK